MVARVVFVASAYVLHVFTAYYFNDPVLYGNLAVALSISSIGLVFIQFGFPQSISKFISENRLQSYEVFLAGRYVYMIFGFIIFLTYLCFTPLWVYITKDSSFIYILLVSSMLIPLFSYNNSFMAYLNGCQRFKEQAFFVALYPLNRIFFAIIFILLGFEICGVFAGFVCACIINAVLLRKKIHQKQGNKKFSSEPIVKFAIPIVFMSIGISLYMSMDMIIIKYFYQDSDVVGFYAASSAISKIPYYIYFAYSMTLIPIISRYINISMHNESICIIKKCLYTLCSMIAVSSIIVAMFSTEIIDFVYPKGYSSLAHVMSILFLSMGILSLFQTLSSIFISINNVYISAIVIYCILVMEVGMSVYSIPRFGIIGMAYSSIIPVIFGSVTLMVLLLHRLKEIGTCIKSL
ncbi:oligosaccharide flippase family protein [Desulfoplanes formicivorans]|nr:oligosaccharide flippase family protein [Desulfoplanes formicivorans]